MERELKQGFDLEEGETEVGGWEKDYEKEEEEEEEEEEEGRKEKKKRS